MQVSIRELKANPARAIELMQQGEHVQITSHRKVVAELVPPGTQHPALTDEQAMQRMIASGLLVEPATQAMRLGKPIVFPPGRNRQNMGDLILELRGPR